MKNLKQLLIKYIRFCFSPFPYKDNIKIKKFINNEKVLKEKYKICVIDQISNINIYLYAFFKDKNFYYSLENRYDDELCSIIWIFYLTDSYALHISDFLQKNTLHFYITNLSYESYIEGFISTNLNNGLSLIKINKLNFIYYNITKDFFKNKQLIYMLRERLNKHIDQIEAILLLNSL